MVSITGKGENMSNPLFVQCLYRCAVWGRKEPTRDEWDELLILADLAEDEALTSSTPTQSILRERIAQVLRWVRAVQVRPVAPHSPTDLWKWEGLHPVEFRRMRERHGGQSIGEDTLCYHSLTDALLAYWHVSWI